MPISPDTLTCDTTLLERFRADESYNYARELQAPDMSMWDWLVNKIGQWLADIFAIRHTGDLRSFLYMVIALATIGGIAWLLYHFRTRLFGRSGAIEAPAEDEDTIYGVDFDEEYTRAMGQGDYYKAVRMVYLRTLRRLSDRHLISWEPYKTPTQYTREYPSAPFSRMTIGFMRVRYGNYPPTKDLVEQLLAMENDMEKGEPS